MSERIAALFDIDGTLIITGGAGAAAWRLAFDELYGIPADIGEFTDTGMTDPDDYRVLDGVEELLPQMLEEGYLLGLVTGNVEAAAHIKLHRARLNRYFSFGGYGSDSTDRGELTRVALRRAAVVSGGSVIPDQAFVVGDTPHDVAAAHAAGVPCVGVASHQYTAEQLRAGGADWVIDSLAEGLRCDRADSGRTRALESVLAAAHRCSRPTPSGDAGDRKEEP
jgi:phosphoglycolate phosphatase